MIARDLAEKVRQWAEQYPVVTITGPRQSGKTTLAKTLFPKKSYLSLEELDVRRFAREDPRGFLHQYREGAIFDEIQNAPELLSYLQSEVDADDRPGRFILTGSRHFELMEKVSQSLAGRTAIARLLPLSLAEVWRFQPEITSDELIYAGFYPRIYDKGLSPSEALSFYLSTYVERDVRQMLNLPDLSRFETFLRLCAGRCGQLMNMTAISNEIGITHPTIRSWLSILEASHIIKLLKPWHANISKRLVKTPKLYFIDVGLASHLLGIQSAAQAATHPLHGHLFENLIVSEALKQRFNVGLHDNLLFYRDHIGTEVDLVLEYADGYAACEIKAARTVTPSFYKGLRAFGELTGKCRDGSIIYRGTRELKPHDTHLVPWRKFRVPQE